MIGMSFNIQEESEVQSSSEKKENRGPKFGKSSSLSSVRTASEGYLQQETLCRKIHLQQKEAFIQMITEDNLNMKQAAKKVSISYSTAKKIYARFRRQLKKRLQIVPPGDSGTLRSVAVALSQPISGGGPMVEIVSTIAGRLQPLQKEAL